jgi:hypothetical protein
MSRTIPTLLALVTLSLGCQKAVAPTPAAPPAVATEPHTATTDEAGRADGHEGHAKESAEAKVSDLDQPVDALLAKTCEHGKKTFECAECRYEVGVARVPKAMLDDGLVKTSVAARRKLEAPLGLTGEIKFDERRVTHIAPSTEAMVRAVRVSLGQRVQAGESLVELESVALGEAQSQYLEARGALELARRAAERAESLHQEKIASEKEWLQARSDHETAEIRPGRSWFGSASPLARWTGSPGAAAPLGEGRCSSAPRRPASSSRCTPSRASWSGRTNPSSRWATSPTSGSGPTSTRTSWAGWWRARRAPSGRALR